MSTDHPLTGLLVKLRRGTFPSLNQLDPESRRRRSILDPELTVSLPPTVTADCGYDALVHAIEPYVWEFQSDLVDALSVAAARTIFAWLPQAVADGNDLQAREKMHLASLQGYGGSPRAKRECGTFATPNGPVSLERCDAAVVQQP